MGEFNFEKALAMARAIERGESIPRPSDRIEPKKKPETSFDYDALVNRAKASQRPKADEDEERFAQSL